MEADGYKSLMNSSSQSAITLRIYRETLNPTSLFQTRDLEKVLATARPM